MFYVLVPVYNVEKYIAKSIQSVIIQTYTNWNLILIDDGSTDNCGNICEQYAKKDSRITVIHKKNQGLISARRMAINYVVDNNKFKNSYAVFLDSDDSLKEYALETINNYIESSGCDIIIYGMDRTFNNEIIRKFKPVKEQIIYDKKSIYRLMFTDYCYNPLCRKACSCNILKKDNYEQYYSISRSEDLLQSIQLYKSCNSIYIINKSLYNHTLNPESITQSVNYDNYKVDNTIRKKVFEFLESEKVFDKDDFYFYRTYCVKLIIKSLIMISRFNTNNQNKIELFNSIKNDEYFIEYIKEKSYNKKALGIQKYIYHLFIKNRYLLLINLIKMYSYAKKRKK